MSVKAFLELKQRPPKFLEDIEGLPSQQLLLQRTDEPLGHAVALRCLDEAQARPVPKEAVLPLEGIAHILRTMVMHLGLLHTAVDIREFLMMNFWRFDMVGEDSSYAAHITHADDSLDNPGNDKADPSRLLSSLRAPFRRPVRGTWFWVANQVFSWPCRGRQEGFPLR